MGELTDIRLYASESGIEFAVRCWYVRRTRDTQTFGPAYRRAWRQSHRRRRLTFEEGTCLAGRAPRSCRGARVETGLPGRQEHDMGPRRRPLFSLPFAH